MSELVKCVKCAEEKPRDAFYKSPRKLNGLDSWCKACHKAKSLETGRKRQYTPEYQEYARWYGIQKRYGLSKGAFMALWEDQSGACGICSSPLSLSTPKGVVVDHNHISGEVRGLLCHKCNTGIGLLNDSPSVLEAAIAYLKTKGHYGQSNGSTEASL
jgi:hypothetical protein